MIGMDIGSYRITEKLGEGGMGTVFKGIDQMLEREVAIKMLRPDFTREPEIVERFRAEAKTLAKLNHPNIATLHSLFQQNDDYFMVMEFVRGETFDGLIRRTGAIPAERAVAMFNQALAGIGEAHSMGIIHRDIKPANMMLTEKGSVKVMDFGIARMLGASRMTRQGTIIGTIQYMSPEQIQGLDTDARSDIYSLGILLYEMLTGKIPFSHTSEFTLMMMQINDPPPPPRVYVPHIPLHIEQAIMRALAKKPEARFQTVYEFRTALEARQPSHAQQMKPTAGGQKASTNETFVAGTASVTPLQDEVATQKLDSRQSPAKTLTVTQPPYQPVPLPGPQGTQIVQPNVNAPYYPPAPMNYAPVPPTVNQGGYAAAPASNQHFAYATGTAAKPGLNWSHYIAALLFVALLGGGAWYFISANNKPEPKPTVTTPPAPPKTESQNPAPPQSATDTPVKENRDKPAEPEKPKTTNTVTADDKDDAADKTTDSSGRRPRAKDAADEARDRARKARDKVKEARKLLDQ